MHQRRLHGTRALILAAPLLAALLACRSKATSTEATGGGAATGTPAQAPGPGGGVTITQSGDGGVSVSGGAPMKGDPKVCAAYQACCSHPEMGLFCALTQAAVKGDCKRALDGARAHLDERGLTAPAGCK